MKIKNENPQIENTQDDFCRLCHIRINDENFQTIDTFTKNILGVIFPNLDINETADNIMCMSCSTKLLAAYEFKSTCVDTEDTLTSYVGNDKILPVDLMEICLEEKVHEPENTAENQQICRLCMQLMTFECSPFGNIEVEMMQMYIPEVRLHITKNPVICNACLESLIIYTGFIKNCLDLKSGIKIQCDNHIAENHYYSSTVEIKEEQVEIKSEEKSNEDKQDSNQKLSINNNIERHRANSNINKLKNAGPSKPEIYECEDCSYQTVHKGHLNTHRLKHADPSQVRMFNCDNCSYKTLYKSDLKRHTLKHADPSKVEMFKCDACSYQTLYEHNFKFHKLKHADPANVKMFKCNECAHQTLYKHNLKFHKLKHADPSKVEMIKCDTCSFKTKCRRSLKDHKLKHTDSVEMFDCDKCPFKTKYKRALKDHKLKHRDLSEVELFECEKCSFKSKYRRSLKKHKLKHGDP